MKSGSRNLDGTKILFAAITLDPNNNTLNINSGGWVRQYIGAAYEHEFDGKARATTNGFDIGAPSLRGDTGIGELGLTLKPAKNLPLF